MSSSLRSVFTLVLAERSATRRDVCDATVKHFTAGYTIVVFYFVLSFHSHQRSAAVYSFLHLARVPSAGRQRTKQRLSHIQESCLLLKDTSSMRQKAGTYL